VADDEFDRWPPRWHEPQWKPQRGTAKDEAEQRRARREQREAEAKANVRRRDRYCRFPLCGCDRERLARHVAHARHKGMGGNPLGERSDPEQMILLCSARHRESVYSFDKGTVEIAPLTPLGFAGPCVFTVLWLGDWHLVGREERIHEFQPFDPEQRHLLRKLAELWMLH
jgi:hypothetical protein